MSTPPADDMAESVQKIADADEVPDLEDGEIDEDDEGGLVSGTTNNIEHLTDDSFKESVEQRNVANLSNKTTKNSHGSDTDLGSNTGTSTSPMKSKKPKVVEDDHASIIEHAIANALKKKGIEPPMPKLMESRSDPDSIEPPNQGQSRSSRRRKRKRQRDELEKEQKEKKRISKEITESASQKPSNTMLAPPIDEDELDDYEMLNVRNGSPPPGNSVLSGTLLAARKYDSHDEDSCNSYDSYVSEQQHRYDDRRSKKPKESRKSRRERAKGREERDGRGGDKRSHCDSQTEESKHRQEPRKLELCKFYLMDCCAKKDKCSYMHSDFPCKYYYLGMECTYGEQCKFSHGKPLTEQLRNILLKHLETAPKEILGPFKRISRETAIAQMTIRHGELCKKFGVENKFISLATQSANTSSGNSNNGDNQQHQQAQAQQQQKHHQPQIPSLLDIVIKPPSLNENNQLQKDKHRKSRWCDNGSINNDSNTDTGTMEESSNAAPIELKSLSGLVKEDIIEKLSQFGVVNLEQVNQLRFGQLTKIGLTIADISELQMNAENLQLIAEKASKSEEIIGKADDKVDINRDVDMRYMPSGSNARIPTHTSYLTNPPDQDVTECSNSNSNSSNGGVVLVDYSQYLKDSNLSYDRGDFIDDEKDEEQLVIDDGLDAVEEATVMADKVEEEGTSIQEEETVGLKHTIENFERNSPTVSDSFKSLYTKSDDLKEYRDPRGKSASVAYTSFADKYQSIGSAIDKKSPPCSPETPKYERPSMYDYNPKYAAENNKLKADKDMRLNTFSLPFHPAPATEIDASINSHLPIPWKLYEVELPRVIYSSQSFTSNNTIDPRVRRILQLPELPKSAATLGQSRSSSTSIASPESSESASPSYYTPSSISNVTAPSITPSNTIYSTQTIEEREKQNHNKNTASTTSRLDPRRAAAVVSNASSSTKAIVSSAAQKQNVEIRNLLQKSDWYQNLSSTLKIMVNQQLALVSTELKQFHQDSAPDKIFDSQFIVNNSTLQQILTNLGIYIDYNGEVIHLNNDGKQNQCAGGSNILPNLSQMPPNMQQVPYMQHQKQIQCVSGSMPNVNQMPPVSLLPQQFEFLRGPPPNIPPPVGPMQYMPNSSQHINIISPFGIRSLPSDMPNITRPSLLGMPPVLTHGSSAFNQPFANMLASQRLSMLGGSPEFGNLRGGPGMQNINRHFGNQRHNRNSRQNKN